jgi:tRNA(Ile2) C34 agmatinyltransferase TiaS
MTCPTCGNDMTRIGAPRGMYYWCHYWCVHCGTSYAATMDGKEFIHKPLSIGLLETAVDAFTSMRNPPVTKEWLDKAREACGAKP